MATAFRYIPYIGWDIIVIDAGEFSVIEANNCTGVRIFQVYRPLLADSRTRRFYEQHAVV